MEVLSHPSLRADTYKSIYINIYIHIYVYLCVTGGIAACAQGLFAGSPFVSLLPFNFFFYSSLWRCISSYIQAGTRVHTRTGTHHKENNNNQKETKLGFSSIYLSVYRWEKKTKYNNNGNKEKRKEEKKRELLEE
ncbi:hypothetical protein LMJF_36_1265 [Leishmania major strain Friedlin]|uniref:Uncharacterized protein n=1 Tax=Leishmania major TaxID=5664 RepID=E9AG14_LEIMA|nr:hypothetical protein LMJF_36_1265 [Leishmania major strain Friedlin]CAG9583645.1 fructose-1_-6-bisphosphate_aldolase [Leishmania major strain Friedlin]CBZ05898.1 hypothetical protein LMJF_36_1265 [Leishmania major strain Friedlin]|eukprot:XP_003722934.1 hypothetical protein LMJF_36_1265 [Leishmania major strain Friedlin]